MWARTLTFAFAATLFLASTPFSPAHAEAPKVPDRASVKISTHIETSNPDDPILVGKPFTLGIDVEHEPGFIALLPTSLDLGAAIAERPSARKHTRRRSANAEAEIDEYRLALIAFESGPQTIPAIPFAVGSTTTATSPFDIEVATNFSPDEMPIATSTRTEAIAELEKMAAPNPAPAAVLVDDFTLIYVLAGLLALVGLFFGLRQWLRLRSQAHNVASPKAAPPQPPAHEEAFRRLRQLAEHQADTDDKTFFVEISNIMRTYLGRRYDFDSLELTLDELMNVLARAPRPNLDIKLLKTLLSEADLVKFARYTPEPEERTSALNTTFGLVEATKAMLTPHSHENNERNEKRGENKEHGEGAL